MSGEGRNARALALLKRWRDASLYDDANALGDLTSETTDLLDGEAVHIGDPLGDAYSDISAAIEALPSVAPGAVDRETVLGIVRTVLLTRPKDAR